MKHHNPKIHCAVWKSPPVRGRGLKLISVSFMNIPNIVAPRAGAWIETYCGGDAGVTWSGRPPCGGVD